MKPAPPVAALAAVSRLLDEALSLPPAARRAWLAALRAAQHEHLPALHDMLAECDDARHGGFMARGPQLDDDPAAAGAVAGPYRLLRPIGRGGMSCVWLAERSDGAPRRAVALKMPLDAWAADGDDDAVRADRVERFEREREVLARLNHPQIARLYDAGVAANGRPYIVMEHVDGLPITAACDALQLDVATRLAIFVQVLAAVDHAHRHMVVHRDIKPSNVFVDRGGQVKLLDFGIAKLLGPADGRADLTATGGCALTPRYAAPEQIERGPVSTATDVYALGVLLYELLTGALPHADEQASMAEAVNAALHREPLPPSRAGVDAAVAARRGLDSPAALRSRLAGDLDTIVLKALRRAPGDRYASAERFADDLRCHLEHRPIAARPATPLHRLRLFARRHRAACGVSAAGLFAAVVLLLLLGQQHGAAQTEAARAEAVREFMLDLVESAEPEGGAPGAVATGPQMVDAGLRRAGERFAAEPRLLGEVLVGLARMLLRFGDDARALSTLDEGAALLQRHAPADDPALNKARVLQAQAALAAGDVSRAHTLAAAALDAAALDACTRADAECAKARAYAGAMLAQVQARRGRVDDALHSLRRSVADTERGFGPAHAETALAWHDLAALQRETGDLPGAERSLTRALALAGRAPVRAADRATVQRTQALLALDLGRFDQAQQLLRAQLAQPADAARRALEWRLLASAELALGQPAEALAAADRALAAGAPGDAGPNAVFALQARSRALSQLGRSNEALATMGRVTQGLLQAGHAADSVPALRARRWVAEMLWRAGELDAAARLLDDLLPQLGARTPALVLERGHALDLLGCVEQARGRRALALQWHRLARSALGASLPAEHPFLARNAQFAERARQGASPGPAVASLDRRPA